MNYTGTLKSSTGMNISSGPPVRDDVKPESEKVTGLNGVTGLWKGTQAQYDAIGIKDPKVVYIIVV